MQISMQAGVVTLSQAHLRLLYALQGYPGTLIATVTYIITREGVLKAVFEATTDKLTPVNMAQHSYFNLAGHASGSVLDHTLYING